MTAQTKSVPTPGRRTKHSGALRISDEVVEQILGRLRRVEGQVQAIQRMIAERRDCHVIAQQMSAARAALDRATVQLMTASMAQCLRPNGHVDDSELNRLAETFTKLLS
jgi:DNA-binding FrmR family transcriptional regulator